ncbi:MAG: substrate-binding domain-containing protein [Nitrososphaeria archaeon]
MNDVVADLGFIGDLRLKKKLFLVRKNAETGLDEDSANLLEAIRRHGSISMAAKAIGKDYRTAWTKIDELERGFGLRIIDRAYGGFGGGSAKLTFEGEMLLQKYLIAQKKIDSYLGLKDILEPDLRVMGSHCNALEVLIKIVEEKHSPFCVEYVCVGSWNGLKLVLEDVADISGVHLFQEETGLYNTFLLQDKSFGDKIALIKGYSRTQGIIVNRGNPKQIRSAEDLLRADVVLVNRNRGSGTRALLDHLIREIALDRCIDVSNLVKKIRGYENEVRSHLEVGVSIKNGKADVGIGIMSVARIMNLDFIPLQSERFDFVLLKEKAESEAVGKFRETLTSKEFNSEVKAKGLGIELNDDVGKIVYADDFQAR